MWKKHLEDFEVFLQRALIYSRTRAGQHQIFVFVIIRPSKFSRRSSLPEKKNMSILYIEQNKKMQL